MATIQGSYILKHSAAQVPFVISFPLCDPEVKSRDKHRCSATKTFPPLILTSIQKCFIMPMEVEAKLICHRLLQSVLRNTYYLIFQGCETCYTLVFSNSAAGLMGENVFPSCQLTLFPVFLQCILFVLFLSGDNVPIKVKRSTSGTEEKKQKKTATQVNLLLFNQYLWEDVFLQQHHLRAGS